MRVELTSRITGLNVELGQVPKATGKLGRSLSLTLGSANKEES